MPAQTPAAAPAKALEHRNHAPDHSYAQTCPACRAADKARSSIENRTLEGKDLDLYTFVVPDVENCNMVCRAYLAAKYPDAQWIGSSIDLAKLGGWQDGEHIIVLRRDHWPRPAMVPMQRRQKDAEDKFVWTDTDMTELIAEVVESAPIDVRACIKQSRADRFTKSQMDYSPLIRKLSEFMVQPYRIDLPKHEDDTVMRMCWQ